MKFRQLAAKNVRGNWHQYSAFFLSSVFSVMIFFIYAAFIFHPDVVSGKIAAAAKVRTGMVACEYVIIIFSFFFVLYSMSAFVKSRKKEFGLFALFGMTSGQIRRMVLYENMVISMLAIGTGIGLGMLFSKLFFMALAQLLDVNSPIRFLIPDKALVYTIVGFLALFLVITLFTLIQIGRSQIIDLLKAGKKPKNVPVFSKWLVLLAAFCLGGGYYLAATMNGMNAVPYILPILFLVVAGTYFLFTQGSVALFRYLQRRRSLYYRSTHLVTIAQLVYKMKDNARILFMVSIMSAIILTASGTFYVFFQNARDQLADHEPQTIGFIERGANAHQVVDPDKVREILKQDGIKISYESKLVGVPTPIKIRNDRSPETTALLVSEEAYNELAVKVGRQTAQVERGHAMYVYPYQETQINFIEKGDLQKTTVGGKPLELTMDGQLKGSIAFPRYEATELIVVDTAQYNELIAGVPDESKLAVYGFELNKWDSAAVLSTTKKIEALVPEKQKKAFLNRADDYSYARQMSSLTLFIGLFVSFLFFIASGSMIYFKLFTELEEDREQFRALTRIGMTVKEISKIVSTQIGMVFYVPCVVGIVHTMFAMVSLSNLMATSTLKYASVVLAIFLVMQTLYFLLARRSYLNKIVKEYAS